jgi:hypothetical protein
LDVLGIAWASWIQYHRSWCFVTSLRSSVVLCDVCILVSCSHVKLNWFLVSLGLPPCLSCCDQGLFHQFVHSPGKGYMSGGFHLHSLIHSLECVRTPLPLSSRRWLSSLCLSLWIFARPVHIHRGTVAGRAVSSKVLSFSSSSSCPLFV